MALSSDSAWADRRIALIVGNSAYQTVPRLPNPSRDANAVGKMFRDAGFDSVEVLSDLGNLDFKRAIRKFEADADNADIAVIYYAGHGIEINGANYLIPVDARLGSDRDAEDEAIRLERMVLSADGAKKLRVIILDACRDNPFTVKMRRERRAALRAIASGLGQVEPTSTDTLIAYAAKAGSTAEDGDGNHSPFTVALLKNLTVPGLDIRLAFGRVRDEVMKITANRQEPFVYGSLGGGNISLVPPPVVEKEASAADVKADFDLVAKINSPRAWEVFLNTYKTGFYADLARAQLASLSTGQQPGGTARDAGNVTVAALPSETPAPGREPSSKERLDFDKVKDATDQKALKAFIRRYPDSPLALQVQQRLEVLERAAAERAEKKRAERAAARLAAEQARLEAERKKAELAAAKKREEEERRAKAAEAAQQAKAAEAERKAAEAKRKAEEAQRRAEERAAAKTAAEAARQKAESERAARQAELERQKAEEERRKAELAKQKEEACGREEGRLKDLAAKGSDGKGLDEVKAFARDVTCERLQPQVAATIKTFEDEIASRLIKSAQAELARIGCFAGDADGQFGPATKAALGRYQSASGSRVPGDAAITQDTVAELTKQTGRVCPLECKTGEEAKGETCVAVTKPVAPPPPPTATRKDDDKPARKSAKKPERAQTARQREPAPRARQEAARPSYGSSSSYSGRSTMIGVGF